jgi:hypothetical protein
MEPDKETTEGEVLGRLKQDISRRLANVSSEWSEADKEAIVDRIARKALRYPEIRDDPRFLR